jgi:cytochrome c oxidase cbb3-type subunit 3
MSRYYKPAFLLTGLLSASGLVYGQSEGVSADDVLQVFLFTLVALALVALLLVFTIFMLVRANLQEKRAAQAEALREQGVEPQPVGPPIFSLAWFKDKLTDNIPIEREEEIDLGHDYDGIRELDNNLPPWWKYGFYLTIVYAVIYMFVFHWSGNDWSSTKEYEEEMAIAAAEKEAYLEKAANAVNENNVALLTDATALAAGEETFVTLCAACHMTDGGGGIGPNLTDNYWIHGGSIKDVFTTIKYGVPEKGMISWQDQLSPKEMSEVASYIMTLVGTTPAAPKEAQGDLYTPAEGGNAPADSTATEPAPEAGDKDEVAIAN